MSKNVCCFTSSNLAYISRSRVLAWSFKKHNPDIDIVLILSDQYPEGFSLNLEEEPFDKIVLVHEIGIPDFINWSFKHNVVELCTAVKASAAKYLTSLYEKVIYLDPDIGVFDSLNFMVELLDSHDILLTPHQLSSCENNELYIKDIELCSLKHGVFNLGFFAVSKGSQAVEFLNWWESRLMRYCYEDIPSGIFTDQKWCDMAPAYFSKLCIIRDPGCNFASWNLFERKISIENGRILVNRDFTLKFYHFTKYGGDGEVMTKRYAQTQDSFEVWFWYGRALKQFSYNLPKKDYYHYGFYNDGKKILELDRQNYRDLYKPGLPSPYAKV